MSDKCNKPTYTVFQHQNVQFVCNDGNYSVIATEPLQVGDTILAEHCYRDTNKENVLQLILHHKYLFNDLSPCTFADNKNDLAKASEKLAQNVFKEGADYVLGHDVSKFSRSNAPDTFNAKMFCYIPSITEHLNTSINFIICTKNIAKGEKIVLSNISSIDDDDIAKQFVFTSKREQAVKKLTLTKKFLHVVVNQHLAYNGFIITDEKFDVQDKFVKYIEKEARTKMNRNMLNTTFLTTCIDNCINSFKKMQEMFYLIATVFVPAHICRKDSIRLLEKSLDSLVTAGERSNSTLSRDCNIYLSISFDWQYEDETMRFLERYKTKTPHIERMCRMEQMIFNVEGQYLTIMEHIYKLYLISQNRFHDFVLICDEDATYTKNRISMFLQTYRDKIYLGEKACGVKELTRQEANDGEVIPYWRQMVKSCVLKTMFDALEGNMDLLYSSYNTKYFEFVCSFSKIHGNWFGANINGYNENKAISNKRRTIAYFDMDNRDDHEKIRDTMMFLTLQNQWTECDQIALQMGLDMDEVFPDRERIKGVLRKMIG